MERNWSQIGIFVKSLKYINEHIETGGCKQSEYYTEYIILTQFIYVHRAVYPLGRLIVSISFFQSRLQ